IGVILWGAVVRATGSGNGCGDHWPLCEGQVIPHAAQIATVIEFAHRLTSGLAVLLVVGLVYCAFRWRGKGHPARRYAAAALFFTLTEGLLGAALVLFGDVGNNVSMSRVFILSLHLVNTFLLLASLALTAKWAGESRFGQPGSGRGEIAEPPVLSRGLVLAYIAALVGTLALAVTGTIAALADTLFHATSFAQGFEWDLSGSSSPLLRLRIIHPALAVFVGTFLIILAVHTLITPAPPEAKRAGAALAGLVALQFFLGLLNVLLLTPVWVQVLHLLNADLLWITLVLLADARLGRQSIRQAKTAAGPAVEPATLAEVSASLRRTPASR
ncbi:MAG: COX15/CtaA family protein, partial [Terriglobia bacterium]